MKKQPIHILKRTVLNHIKAFGCIIMFMVAIGGLVIYLQEPDWGLRNKNMLVLHGVYLTVVAYLIWHIATRPAPDYLGMPESY